MPSISISMRLICRLVANHLLGEFPVLIHQGADAAVNGGLHQPAHFQQLVIQFFEFNREMTQELYLPFRTGRVPRYPNLPVM